MCCVNTSRSARVTSGAAASLRQRVKSCSLRATALVWSQALIFCARPRCTSARIGPDISDEAFWQPSLLLCCAQAVNASCHLRVSAGVFWPSVTSSEMSCVMSAPPGPLTSLQACPTGPSAAAHLAIFACASQTPRRLSRPTTTCHTQPLLSIPPEVARVSSPSSSSTSPSSSSSPSSPSSSSLSSSPSPSASASSPSSPTSLSSSSASPSSPSSSSPSSASPSP